jgi:hypothetical protein
MSVMDIFRKSPPPPFGLPKPTQLTPWLAHLHPRLRGKHSWPLYRNEKSKRTSNEGSRYGGRTPSAHLSNATGKLLGLLKEGAAKRMFRR